MSTIPTKWLPVEFAARLRTLQQGSLAIGNTQQNLLNLTALATAEANAPTTGWARWNPAAPYKLQVQQRLVPGYVAPAGTGYQNVPGGGGGGSSTTVTITVASGSGGPFGSTGSGFMAPGGWGGGLGSISPSAATLNGDQIESIGYDSNTSQFFVLIKALVSQSFFTSVTFTDKTTGVETYLTASAASFAQGSGLHSEWSWPCQFGAGANPFTTGNNYTVTFTTGTVPTTSIAITTGNNGPWTGWIASGSSFAAPIGSVLPGRPMLFGEPVEAVTYFGSSTTLWVVVQGVLAQTFFTSVSFTDSASGVETYLTSAAASFSVMSGSRSIWEWPSAFAGAGNPFISGNAYTINLQ